jgi:hypothetical protein
MRDPNYPTGQPKDAVGDALTDRNSDPAAEVQDEPLKVHGDALLGTSESQVGKKDDRRRDHAGERSD